MNVYIIKCKEFHKVGLAKEPLARLAYLQTGNPETLELVHSRRFGTRKAARMVERFLHKKFKKDQKLGEWFSTQPKVLIDALDKCVSGEININKSKCSSHIATNAKKAEIRLREYAAIKASTDEKVDINRNSILCLMTSGIGVTPDMRRLLSIKFPLQHGWMKSVMGQSVDRLEFLRVCDKALKT